MSPRVKVWLLIVLGWVFIGLSFPVDGLPDAALALAGTAAEFVAVRTLLRGGAR